MVAPKGKGNVALNRPTQEPVAWRPAGIRGFKVHTDSDADIRGIPAQVNKHATLVWTRDLKGTSRDMIKGKEKSDSSGANTGRKPLADVSNVNKNFSKNMAKDGRRSLISVGQSAKTAKLPSTKAFPGKARGSLKPVSFRQSEDSSEREKAITKSTAVRPFDANRRVNARNSLFLTRKSLPVLKRVDSEELKDMQENARDTEKGKAIRGFPVETKIVKKVVPQVNNVKDRSWKNRVTRRNSLLLTRKSLPVLKRVDNGGSKDMQENARDVEKGKAIRGFAVRTKVVKKLVPQANNAKDRLWKDRVSDGFIMTASKNEASTDSRVSLQKPDRPVLRTTAKFRNAQGTSQSGLKMSMPIAPVASKSKEEAGSSICKSAVNVDTSKEKKEKVPSDVNSRLTVPVNSIKGMQERLLSDAKSKSEMKTSKTSTRKPELTSKNKEEANSSICKNSAQVVQGELSSESESKPETKTIEISRRKSERRRSFTSMLMAQSKLLEHHGEAVKQEKLPSIDDGGNHLEVAEYVDDIYRYYWIIEEQNTSLEDYLSIQTEITPQLRGILINWLIEVHFKFDLMQETLYLMVTLLDRYLSLVTIKKNEMQLVGLAALLLASKYEDFWHPRVKDLISISAESYTRDQILGMEKHILNKLKFRMNAPTPYVFMLRFLKAAQSNTKLEHLSFHLIELCLVEYEALKFKPSLLCAAAVFVARCTLQISPPWTPLLVKHTRYEVWQIKECANMVLRIQKAARTRQLSVTYDKYTRSELSGVAHIKPLDRLPL